MRRIRIAIIGAGREGSSLYYCFRMKSNVDIVGIADITGQGIGLDDAIRNGIVVTKNVEDITGIDDLDVIVETTKDPSVAEAIHRLKRPDTQVVESSSLDLMMALGNKKEKTEAELFSLTGSIQDAVLITDKDGNITYVNKGFEKLTGISATEITGSNIYDKYPDSPVARSLSSGQQMNGSKYSFNNEREVNYSITPVIIREQTVGVLGIFKTIPDIIRLMEELQRSTTIIEGLYEKLGQINGLSELNISDIMPIDKMEQIMLRQALMKYGYSVEGKKRAARALNISLATLYNKLKKYQIN